MSNKNVFPMGGAPEWRWSGKVSEITPDAPPAINVTYGTSDDNATIEVEKGEVILTPELKVYKVKGESHANGGVPYFAQGGEFIYSERIKMKGSDIKNFFSNLKFSSLSEEIQNKLRANLKEEEELDVSGLSISDDKLYSMADIANKFKTNQDLFNLEEEMNSSNMFTKSSAKFNIQGKLKNLSILSNLQEMNKAMSGSTTDMSKYEMGGEYEVSEDEAEYLKSQGFDFEIL